MSLWKIAWRSIQQRALASTLTAVAMGLGVALVVAVLVIHEVIRQSFNRGGGGYELIVGKQGSQLQLVLNSAYYVGDPVGNIPYSFYEKFTVGEYALDVERAVPICMGHSYNDDYPVVGTTPEMFDLEYLGGEKYEFDKGGNFESHNLFDAVIGSTVARETTLKRGSEFQAVHGAPGQSGRAHDQLFTVVGILKHTGTPSDRAVFVNINGFSRLHRHQPDRDKDDSDAPDADHPEEVTAILVCVDPNKPGKVFSLHSEINKGSIAQAAMPRVVIDGFLKDIIGNVQLILLIMAVLIVVVAGMGIMVSIYNSMSDRRHEIAVMRALGASRLTVMIVILLESILLSLGGGIMGLVLGHGLIAVLSPVIAEQMGVAVALVHFHAIELVLIPGLIVLASLVGYLPAVAAYRTDVARSLTATP